MAFSPSTRRASNTQSAGNQLHWRKEGRRLSQLILEETVDQRFSGKLALVSGGTGGLGRAVTLAFLAAGAHVAVPYFDQKEFDDLKAAASSHATRLEGQSIDVTDEATVRGFVDGVLAKKGRSRFWGKSGG